MYTNTYQENKKPLKRHGDNLQGQLAYMKTIKD